MKLEKETNKGQNKFESVYKTLDETTVKLDEAKSKLSKYNARNVNKRQKKAREQIFNNINRNTGIKKSMRAKG